MFLQFSILNCYCCYCLGYREYTTSEKFYCVNVLQPFHKSDTLLVKLEDDLVIRLQQPQVRFIYRINLLWIWRHEEGQGTTLVIQSFKQTRGGRAFAKVLKHS